MSAWVTGVETSPRRAQREPDRQPGLVSRDGELAEVDAADGVAASRVPARQGDGGPVSERPVDHDAMARRRARVAHAVGVRVGLRRVGCERAVVRAALGRAPGARRARTLRHAVSVGVLVARVAHGVGVGVLLDVLEEDALVRLAALAVGADVVVAASERGCARLDFPETRPRLAGS